MRLALQALALGLLLVGCGGDSGDSKDDPAPTSNLPSDAQTPPTGASAVDAWLAEGHYLDWNCEAEAHSRRSPSAHSRNRICSNTKLAATAATDIFPVGSASVKELFSGDSINGYAVMLHTSAEDSGAAWYYYEKIGSSVVADGNNVSLCDGCHSDAGTDDNSGHHRIFTIVTE